MNKVHAYLQLSKHDDTKNKLRNCEILMVIGKEGGGLTKLCLLHAICLEVMEVAIVSRMLLCILPTCGLYPRHKGFWKITNDARAVSSPYVHLPSYAMRLASFTLKLFKNGHAEIAELF